VKRVSILVLLLAACVVSAVSSVDAQMRRGVPISTTTPPAPVPGLRGFGVVLVQGEMQAGAPGGEAVPAASLKALNDLKDFLPYKSYKLLDTQWTMGSGRLIGSLRGPENTAYTFEVEARPGGDAGLLVSRFLLRGPGDDRMSALYARGLASRDPIDDVFAKIGPMARSLIDTSFSMDIGETVVVGTSRLQGNNALIVLLTAVSKSAAAK
jgi:hypothetical protein